MSTEEVVKAPFLKVFGNLGEMAPKKSSTISTQPLDINDPCIPKEIAKTFDLV